jgi:hypothetical protein
MKRLLVLLCLLAAGCAERPLIGITISNSPGSLESCVPPKPGGDCR